MLASSKVKVGMELSFPSDAAIAKFNRAVFKAVRGAQRAWLCLPILLARRGSIHRLLLLSLHSR